MLAASRHAVLKAKRGGGFAALLRPFTKHLRNGSRPDNSRALFESDNVRSECLRNGSRLDNNRALFEIDDVL